MTGSCDRLRTITIADHLTQHGVMDAGLLYESPFTDLAPQGPETLFPGGKATELFTILANNCSTALAA